MGVCQLTQHDALDAATQGFVDALNTILGSEHVNIDVQVASGDSTTCTPIVNSFVNKKVDLIMANATPALQAAYNATTSIPFSAPPSRVRRGAGTLRLQRHRGRQHQRHLDLAPLTEQADMILGWCRRPRLWDCYTARRAQLRISGEGGGGLPLRQGHHLHPLLLQRQQ